MAELIVTRAGPVATIAFSNPKKFNAVSLDMWEAFPRHMQALDADPAVRVIVITGDGDKAFISGADISQFESARASEEAQARYNVAVENGYMAPVLCGKPVIARIRGICMGGGLGLAAACDVRMAAEGSVFRMPAGRMGLGYNFVGMKRFVDVIGPMNAADIFYSARKFDAADALRMGFLARVIPAAEFDGAVAEYVALIAANAPLTLAAAKRAIREVRTDPAARDLEGLKGMIAACYASEDYREGRTAFMEKRTPQFKGK
jgi:enoyl-CoA hydratase